VLTEEFKVSILKALNKTGVLRAYTDEAFVTTLTNRIMDIPIQDEGESAKANKPDIQPDPWKVKTIIEKKSNPPTGFLFRRRRQHKECPPL
jgi:hypothetical protein